MRGFAGFLTLGVCALSSASINLHLDIQDQDLVRPLVGSNSVTFTGMIDTTAGWDATTFFADIPFLQNSTVPSLVVTINPGLLAYVASNAPGVDYVGDLFTVTVDSTDPLGWYAFKFNSSFLSETGVIGQSGSLSYDDREMYTVNVTAVPEPATMAVLGLGALGLIRRRKNRG